MGAHRQQTHPPMLPLLHLSSSRPSVICRLAASSTLGAQRSLASMAAHGKPRLGDRGELHHNHSPSAIFLLLQIKVLYSLNLTWPYLLSPRCAPSWPSRDGQDTGLASASKPSSSQTNLILQRSTNIRLASSLGGQCFRTALPLSGIGSTASVLTKAVLRQDTKTSLGLAQAHWTRQPPPDLLCTMLKHRLTEV